MPKKNRTKIENPDFLEIFKTAESEIFRLEALPSYDVGAEDKFLNCYYDGKHIPSSVKEVDGLDSWFNELEKLNEEGRPCSRVRVVSRVLSPYEKYELDLFDYTDTRGEKLNILLREQNSDVENFWQEEYYIIDNKDVYYICYDADNKYLGYAEKEEDPQEIKDRVKEKEVLLSRSVPLRDFLGHMRKNAKITVPDIPSVKEEVSLG